VVDVNGKVRLTGPFSSQGRLVAARARSVGGAGHRGDVLDGRDPTVWFAPGGRRRRRARPPSFAYEPRREWRAGAAKTERNLTCSIGRSHRHFSGGATVLFNEQNIRPMGLYLRKLDGSTAVRVREATRSASPDGRWGRSPRKGWRTASSRSCRRESESRGSEDRHRHQLRDVLSDGSGSSFRATSRDTAPAVRAGHSSGNLAPSARGRQHIAPRCPRTENRSATGLTAGSRSPRSSREAAVARTGSRCVPLRWTPTEAIFVLTRPRRP
jgi:hypothetical protein